LVARREFTKPQKRFIKSRLNKKVKDFADNELTILVEKGYLDVTEFRNVTENCNALVAQLAERGFDYDDDSYDNENKSPSRDLNPGPKVSAPSPPFRIMERGITKPIRLWQPRCWGCRRANRKLRSWVRIPRVV
jgi:hypothetical protein